MHVSIYVRTDVRLDSNTILTPPIYATETEPEIHGEDFSTQHSIVCYRILVGIYIVMHGDPDCKSVA